MKIENTNFVFDPIAARYDFCNRLFSMGLDRRWRKALVCALAPQSCDKILDLCSGTGDVVFSFLKHSPAKDLTALDLSEPMLHLAQEKQILIGSKKWMRGAQIKYHLADIAATSLESSSYDIATCAFGIRNVTDRQAALVEISRLLKPSGRLGLLEFSLPSNRLLRALYLFYLQRLMPIGGRLFFRDPKPLSYLAASIDHWQNQVDFTKELIEAGFTNIKTKPLCLGIVTLWLAQKA